MRRMHEQKFETPGIARLVRHTTAEDRQGCERPVDQDARLIRTGIPEFKRVAPLRAAPASAGAWCARWQYLSCLAEGARRQGCS